MSSTRCVNFVNLHAFASITIWLFSLWYAFSSRSLSILKFSSRFLSEIVVLLVVEQLSGESERAFALGNVQRRRRAVSVCGRSRQRRDVERYSPHFHSLLRAVVHHPKLVISRDTFVVVGSHANNTHKTHTQHTNHKSYNSASRASFSRNFLQKKPNTDIGDWMCNLVATLGNVYIDEAVINVSSDSVLYTIDEVEMQLPSDAWDSPIFL